MFNASLTVNDGSGDHVFDLVAQGNYSTVRREAAAALDKPNLVTVSHNGVDTGKHRSLVRFDQTVEDAEGNQDVVSAYMVLVVPSKIATTAQATAVATSLKNFLSTSGYIGKLINLEC